jgi:RES domain-containing protein
MIVHRLAITKYSNDLSGIGAEITGGRWNYKGTRVLYTADSRALCMAEIAVHSPVGIMPIDYNMITIELPDFNDAPIIKQESLPNEWRKFPYSNITQEIGENFIQEREHLYIQVPSAVVQGDYNILVNPLHKYFEKVQILNVEKFHFDERLFNR